MAKKITSIKKYERTREEQVEQDLDEVKEAVADNKNAIMNGIKLLSTLDEEGTLEAVTSLLKAKDAAAANAVKELDKDQYEPLLRNLPELVFLLGEIDVNKVREVTSCLNNGLESLGDQGTSEKTSYFDLAKALKDPEINRSITMIMHFLKGMGR